MYRFTVVSNMKYQIIVTTVLGNVAGIHTTTKDMTKFRNWNELRTRLNLKYGPHINIQLVEVIK